MLKQRLISIVAVLCLAQLAVTASHQLQDNGSDLNELRGTLETFARHVTDLFSGDDAATSSDRSAKTQGSPKTASMRSGELAPLMADDSDSTTDKSAKTQDTQAKIAKDRKTEIKSAAPARDPFVPFFSIRNNSRGDGAGSLTDYDVSELRVAAIVSDGAGNRSASIEASDGKSFIVRVGTKIGENGGRVETITATTIVISEPAGATFGNGGATTKELSLKTTPPAPSGRAD